VEKRKLERTQSEAFQRGLEVFELADQLMKDQADHIERQAETIRLLSETIRNQAELIEKWKLLMEFKL
jgi:hypothetical protein